MYNPTFGLQSIHRSGSNSTRGGNLLHLHRALLQPGETAFHAREEWNRFPADLSLLFVSEKRLLQFLLPRPRLCRCLTNSEQQSHLRTWSKVVFDVSV